MLLSKNDTKWRYAIKVRMGIGLKKLDGIPGEYKDGKHDEHVKFQIPSPFRLSNYEKPFDLFSSHQY